MSSLSQRISDLATAIGAHFKKYSAIVDMGTGTAIDWSAGVRFDKTMPSNTTFTDTNLEKGKVIEVRLDGDYAPSFPSYWNIMQGSLDFDGTVVNRITAECIESSSGSEEVEYSINQQNV